MSDQNKKVAYFLPNIFTALNLGCGFSSVLLSIQGQFYAASMILVLGAVFDLVDGRIARLTGTESEFGEQFDSLSDLISFGMAPSVLFYLRYLTEMGRVGMVAAGLFLLCGAFRLARFNVNVEKVGHQYFQGLPIPSAAMALVGCVLFSTEFPAFRRWDILAVFLMIAVAFLMVSNIPFLSFKGSDAVRKKKKRSLFFLVITIALLAVYEELSIGLLVWLYILMSLIHYGLNHKRFHGVMEWDEQGEEGA